MMNDVNGRAAIFRFSPTIDLGHLIQLGVALAALSGWALFGYLTIDRQLTNESSQRILLQQRTDQNERAISEMRDSQRLFSAEMRAALEKISLQVSDVRTLVAAGAHH